ncbi:hypothetical protein [Cardiobacterium hominis]
MRQGKIVRRIISYPAPERTAPPNNWPYYYPAITGDDAHTLSGIWCGCKHDIALLKKGLIHRTRENAMKHAMALLGDKK